MTPIEIHAYLTGQQPDPDHLTFYYARKKGFSDKSFNKDRFLLVAVLTLYKSLLKSPPSRVVLLMPPTHDKWVVNEFDNFSQVAFKSIKNHPGTPQGRAKMAKLFGSAFKMIFYSSRLLQLPDQPTSWTSFGFSKDDPIPDWMRDGLV